MTAIINGKFVSIDVTRKAMGGTELMAHRMISQLQPEMLADKHIIHSRVRPELLNDDPSKNFLVCHDLPNDPEIADISDPSFRAKFNKIVFVSHWQMQMFNLIKGVPYGDSVVIENGIIPGKSHAKAWKPKDVINIVYHTTPHRGLEILVPVFQKLSEIHPDIHLHVYSSFDIYGWGERNQPYEKLFDIIKKHDKMSYYGSVPNDEIRKALHEKMHIFAYPSIWPETSCLALIEAVSDNVFVIHPNYGALPDTGQGATIMYQWHEDFTTHANIFATNLNILINQTRELLKPQFGDDRKFEKWTNGAKHRIDQRHSINYIKHKEWGGQIYQKWSDLLLNE